MFFDRLVYIPLKLSELLIFIITSVRIAWFPSGRFGFVWRAIIMFSAGSTGIIFTVFDWESRFLIPEIGKRIAFNLKISLLIIIIIHSLPRTIFFFQNSDSRFFLNASIISSWILSTAFLLALRRIFPENHLANVGGS